MSAPLSPNRATALRASYFARTASASLTRSASGTARPRAERLRSRDPPRRAIAHLGERREERVAAPGAACRARGRCRAVRRAEDRELVAELEEEALGGLLADARDAGELPTSFVAIAWRARAAASALRTAIAVFGPTLGYADERAKRERSPAERKPKSGARPRGRGCGRRTSRARPLPSRPLPPCPSGDRSS